MIVDISVDQLRQVAKSIDSSRNDITNLYNTNVKTILESSKEAIVVSGLDFDEFINKFTKSFNSLDTKLGALSDVLLNKIIPNYENLGDEIKRAFNDTFASEMASILSKLN